MIAAGYVCWNQEDETVYCYAVFLQTGVAKLRETGAGNNTGPR